jgi:hypothetical protein
MFVLHCAELSTVQLAELVTVQYYAMEIVDV